MRTCSSEGERRGPGAAANPFFSAHEVESAFQGRLDLARALGNKPEMFPQRAGEGRALFRAPKCPDVMRGIVWQG